MEEIRKYSKVAVDRETGLTFSFSFFFIFFLHCSRSVEAYTNYTVGDSLGWYDELLKPSVDYQKWASSKSFGLGDFLIFNTDTNHSVIQTYNFTTYNLCDSDDAGDKDTIEWSAADPSNTDTRDVSVPVPLVKEGMNYFFSGNYDGEQCENGQRFQINVTHGQGLPLDDSPGPVSPQSGGDDESTPDTIVPANFNDPLEEPTDDQKSGSNSLLQQSLKLHDLTLYIASMSIILLLSVSTQLFFP